MSNLHRVISKPEDLARYDLAELRGLHDQHEVEIVQLVGSIDASEHDDWKRRARQALRYLRLHKDWIARALTERHKESTVQALERQKALTAERKAANIARANEEAMRHIQMFKTVVREVLGDTIYNDLWEETQKRIREQGL